MTDKSLTIEEYEKIQPIFQIPYRDQDMNERFRLSFYVPNKLIAWRVDTLLTKEPDTIAWIATFNPKDIFYDIGANIGLFSIWAATTRHVQTFSFEPESQNYFVLNRNIYLNQLSERIRAFAIALSSDSKFDALHLNKGQDIAGGANHNFGEKLNCNQQPLMTEFSQGCFSISLDELVYVKGLPVPNHIKIDVDGIENKIIQGAQKLLKDPSVRSVLIELNEALDQDKQMIQTFTDLGFSFSKGNYAKSPGLTHMVNYTFTR